MEIHKAKKSIKLSGYSNNIPTFPDIFLKKNNNKQSEYYVGCKINSKREEKQEILIPSKNQNIGKIQAPI